MASNQFPKSAKGLLQLAGKMSVGILKVGASVPVTMITKAQMDAAIAAFSSAESNFGKARQGLKDAYNTFTPAAATLLNWLNAARPIFVSNFGYRWSADWAALGFVNHSTAIPDKIENRLGVARSMVDFLEENPDYEVAKTGVTFADGDAIYNQASDSQGTVATAEQALKDANDVRTPARAGLLQAMRRLTKNLEGFLPANDSRWLAFGLNMPATPTTPAQPTGLTAQLDVVSGGIILTCDPQSAERYRFRGREAGSDMRFQLLARSTQPTALTKPIAGGITMELIVQAVNGGSQSVPSDSIFFTVPLTQSTMTDETVAKPAAMVAKGAAQKSSPNENKNGNGQVAVSRLS